MFKQLEKITEKPALHSACTVEALWNHPHVSKYMLAAHLQADNHIASRKHTFIDQSVAFMIDKFDLNVDKKVIDFGCGPGLYTTRLAQAGIDVTGIDFSNNSIRHAQSVADDLNLPISYINQNYLTFEATTQYDLITMIYCDYCALNDLQRRQLLKTFRSLLKEEGHLFIDVHTMIHHKNFKTGFTYNFHPEGGFWRPTKYYEFVSRFKYDDVTLDKYDVYTENELFQIYNWLKCYTVESMKAEFKAAGLEIVEILGDVSGAPFNKALDTMAAVVRVSKAEQSNV